MDFFTFPVQQTSSAGPNVCVSVWHPQHPLLAVGFADGNVRIYNQDGEQMDADIPIKYNSVPTEMKWHPARNLLAIGWEDGAVSMWTVQGKLLHTEAAIHKDRVSCVEWSPGGDRLVTTGHCGYVIVWQSNAQGRLKKLRSYQCSSAVTKLLFAVRSDRRRNAGSRHSPPFIYGSESGSTYFADDTGRSAKALTLGSAISVILYATLGGRTYLTAITVQNELSQYIIMSDGKLRRTLKVKLSGGAGGAGISSAVMTGDGVLATASMDTRVKLWNFAKDEIYALRIPDLTTKSGERISDVAFEASAQILAATTTKGRVAFWKYKRGDPGVEEDESRWTFLRAVELGATVTKASWAPGRGHLVAHGGGCSWILQQAVTSFGFGHRLLAISTNTSSFTVSRHSSALGGALSQDLVTSHRIVGLSCSHSHALAWGQGKVSVYKVPDGSSQVELAHSFLSKGSVFRLCAPRHVVFAIEGEDVKMLGLDGTLQQTLSLPPDSGRPRLLEVSEHYAVVVTDREKVYVWDVSRRQPRLHGGKFDFSSRVLSHLKVIGADGSSSPVVEKKKNPADDLFAGLNLPPGADQDEHTVLSVAVNCDGSLLAIVAGVEIPGTSHVTPSPRVFLYRMESDSFDSHDFEVESQVPVGAVFDRNEPKLLAVESVALVSKTKKGRRKSAALGATNSLAGSQDTHIMSTLFAHVSGGLMLQDSRVLEATTGKLVGLDVPYVFTVLRPDGGVIESSGAGGKKGDDKKKRRPAVHHDTGSLRGTTLRELEGMEDADPDTHRSLVDFSYYLSVGNLDEAYRAVKQIKNNNIWRNMAETCVRTRRMDVARICLGQCKDARTSRAIRLVEIAELERLGRDRVPNLSVDDSEKEKADLAVITTAQVGTIALHLGMAEDAEKIFASAERYDLLGNLYRATGQWGKAVALAESHDRIHLRNVHYLHGKALEGNGDVAGAISAFEAANMQCEEIPRMLYNTPADLQAYVDSSGNPKLIEWWAQYLEWKRMFPQAIQAYLNANNLVSAVRILCLLNDVTAALRMVLEPDNLPPPAGGAKRNTTAAAFHLARFIEDSPENVLAQVAMRPGKVQKGNTLIGPVGPQDPPVDPVTVVTDLYSHAKAHSHALRVAQAAGKESLLLQLALKCGEKKVLADAARYFEQEGHPDRAVQLYHRSGAVSQAMDLCFRHNLTNELDGIAEDLEADPKLMEAVAPELLLRASENFRENGAHKRAAGMLIAAEKYEESLQLCLMEGVMITEEMAERMTLPKSQDKAKMEERAALLVKVARACKRQGSFHLATKKFTQAGDKMRALKSLLKSGDVEKIVFFAEVSRRKDVYVMTANFLQSLEWRSDPEIMRKITTFYTKARAYEPLANFYAACSQVEVDEYQNYEKAMGALNEAVRCLGKARGATGVEQKLATLQHRIYLIRSFIEARTMNSAGEVVAACESLLHENDLETAVRAGDIYYQMISALHKANESQAAFERFEEMRARGIPTHFFLDEATIQEICGAVGAPVPTDAEPSDDEGMVMED